MDALGEERRRLFRLSKQLDRLDNPCQLCRSRGAIGKIHLAYNFGGGFRRVEYHIEGDFCGKCVSKKFAAFTLINLFGWFGIVSAVKAPYFLLSNCAEYVRSLRLIWARHKRRVDTIDDTIDKFRRSNDHQRS